MRPLMSCQHSREIWNVSCLTNPGPKLYLQGGNLTPFPQVEFWRTNLVVLYYGLRSVVMQDQAILLL